MTEGDLEQLFAGAGPVKEVSISMDRQTRQSKGFGFVEMMTDAEAQKAIQTFNNYELGGRNITMNIARLREERSSGGFRGGNRTGYGTHRGGYGGRRGGRF